MSLQRPPGGNRITMGEKKRGARSAEALPPIPPLPKAIATVCGLGRMPVAPGTAGSLLGALLCLPLLAVPWPVQAGAAAVVAGVAVWASGVAVKGFGGRDPSV